MPDETNLQRVLAAVIRRGGRVLVCQRPAEKRYGGLWEFPGGKIDDGETDLAAIDRELREELNVRVTAVGRVQYSRHDPGSPFVIDFLDVTITGEPECLEHQDLAWVTWWEALDFALAPSDRAFVAHVLARNRSS